MKKKSARETSWWYLNLKKVFSSVGTIRWLQRKKWRGELQEFVGWVWWLIQPGDWVFSFVKCLEMHIIKQFQSQKVSKTSNHRKKFQRVKKKTHKKAFSGTRFRWPSFPQATAIGGMTVSAAQKNMTADITGSDSAHLPMCENLWDCCFCMCSQSGSTLWPLFLVLFITAWLHLNSSKTINHWEQPHDKDNNKIYAKHVKCPHDWRRLLPPQAATDTLTALI